VYAVIHNDKVTSSDKRYLDLTSDQWDLLSELLVVLKPLQVATKALSLERNVSSSLIYPVINGLINCHLKVNLTDLPTIKRFQIFIRTYLGSTVAKRIKIFSGLKGKHSSSTVSWTF